MGGVTITLTRVMGSSSTGLGVPEVLMHRFQALSCLSSLTSNSHEYMGVNGEALEFHAVHKKLYFKSCTLCLNMHFLAATRAQEILSRGLNVIRSQFGCFLRYEDVINTVLI